MEHSEHKCREALEAMYMFLDGEMTETSSSDVRQHLDDCLPCLEAFEFEAELKEMVATRCKEQVPAQLYDRIRSSIASELDQCPSKDPQTRE